MKKIVFLVVALFMSSSSVMAIYLETRIIGLALENETSYYAHVSFNLNNYDVSIKNNWRILEPITLGPHNSDWLSRVAPKAGEMSDQPDEIFFSVSRGWPFSREKFDFRAILNTRPYEYEFRLRGEDGQDTTQLTNGVFSAKCHRAHLDGWFNFFVVNISQRDTIDGKIRDKFAQYRNRF